MLASPTSSVAASLSSPPIENLRVSIETAEPSSGASQRNSPTLHVWLRILDLGPPPTAHGVVVACLMADGEGRPVEVAKMGGDLVAFGAAMHAANAVGLGYTM